MNKLIDWMIKQRELEIKRNKKLFHNSKTFPCRKCKNLTEEIIELESLKEQGR